MSTCATMNITPIKIGAIDYAVEAWDKVESTREERWGQISEYNHTIQVDTECQDWQIVETIAHEIGHAICTRCDLEVSEHVISTVSASVAALLRDNPQLVEWIMSISDKG